MFASQECSPPFTSNAAPRLTYNVFIPRHKMEIILLGVCVYDTLLKLYLLVQLFQNNDVKLATSIIGRNGAVNTAQLLASLFGASQCL